MDVPSLLQLGQRASPSASKEPSLRQFHTVIYDGEVPYCLFFFFLKILFFPFSPQSPPVHCCIFFVVSPSSCGMWDAASAWVDEQCHVRAQDLNQRNTGPPAAECVNLTTRPRGEPHIPRAFISALCDYFFQSRRPFSAGVHF